MRMKCDLLCDALRFIPLLMTVSYNPHTEHTTETLKRCLLNTHGRIVVGLLLRSRFKSVSVW